MKLFGRNKKTAKDRLREVLGDADPPTFPEGVVRLLKLLRDPDTDLASLAAALEWDPGLVVRVLRTANSAAYGAKRRIDSVAHAVSMMGRCRLEQLVLGLAVQGVLPRRPAPGYEARRFWEAAFFRAALARALASELHPAEEALSFTGGLLQDMAVPLLAHARPEYGRVLEDWHASPADPLHALEHQSLGFSHAEVGGHLAVAWDLPETLSAVIEHHHSPPEEAPDLPPALHLVALHRETAPDDALESLVEEARARYDLAPDTARSAVEAAGQQARELAQAFS